MSTIIKTTTQTVTESKESEKNVYPRCETCGKTNHSREKCYHGANAANRPPPRQRRPETQNQVQEIANQNDSNETTQAAAQKKFKLKMPRLHSLVADRPEVTHLKLPTIPEVV